MIFRMQHWRKQARAGSALAALVALSVPRHRIGIFQPELLEDARPPQVGDWRDILSDNLAPFHRVGAWLVGQGNLFAGWLDTHKAVGEGGNQGACVSAADVYHALHLGTLFGSDAQIKLQVWEGSPQCFHRRDKRAFAERLN